MLNKLEKLHYRYSEVEKMISDPAIMGDQKRYKELMIEYSHLKELDDAYLEYKKMSMELADAREMINEETDPEMKEMAKEEIKDLESSVLSMEDKVKLLLVPKDPLDGKNIIMEIRAGTGGDEAALFASDLYRMYTRYAESKGWKVEVISSSEIELGGFKEIIVSISGKSVYADLRYESGGHRVQRIPITESGGRIQTSAATVAVLPEAEDTDIDIKNEDLKIDVFRASGPGGQSVNTTDSAVRITHLPTGLVVSQQDEKSQIKNKAKALRVLKSRLFELEEKKKNDERAADRKSQVGSGDRSERIRTYNYPQGRVTDHRINLTLYKLDSIIQGSIGEIVGALKMNAQEEALKKGV